MLKAIGRLEVFPDQILLFGFLIFMVIDLFYTYIIKKNIKVFPNKYYNLNLYFGYAKVTTVKLVSVFILYAVFTQNIPHDLILVLPIAVYAFYVIEMVFHYFRYDRKKNQKDS